jgi:hypothetical protein
LFFILQACNLVPQFLILFIQLSHTIRQRFGFRLDLLGMKK